jgi:hypothetical protein
MAGGAVVTLRRARGVLCQVLQRSSDLKFKGHLGHTLALLFFRGTKQAYGFKNQNHDNVRTGGYGRLVYEMAFLQ